MRSSDRKLVLLVDDEENYLEIARMLLQGEEDLVVITARDGRCALRLLDVVEPDVILTDMMMPVLDGFGFLREYTQRANSAPVIATSALVAYLAHACELGAVAALVKPFDAATLIKTVREVLARQPVAVPAPSELTREDETKRLQAILDLHLDEPAPEPEVQMFLERVAAHFEVPMALFSVVTADSQFWTAGCGIPEDLAEVRGTARQESFCTHSVAARAALVVQDTLENPFFCNNVLVQTRGLRFYAGVPLFARHGEAIGTLCVLDGQPHAFTHCDLELLTVFGRRLLALVEWREHLASPEIPVGAFRYLEYVDRDLDIFGAAAFRDLAVIQAARGLQANVPVTCVVIAMPARRLRDAVARLAARHPRGLLGRLGHARLGWLVPGLSKADAEAAALEIVAPHAFVRSVELGHYIGAVPALLHRAEQELGDAGLV